MKKFALMVFLPAALFALERVNLIKDAGFEKDNGAWNSYSSHDSAYANSYDSEKSLHGFSSGYVDTRKNPLFIVYDSAVVIQGFSNKTVADIESLFVNMAVTPLGEGFGDSLSNTAFFGLETDAGKPSLRVSGYFILPPEGVPGPPPHLLGLILKQDLISLIQHGTFYHTL